MYLFSCLRTRFLNYDTPHTTRRSLPALFSFLLIVAIFMLQAFERNISDRITYLHLLEVVERSTRSFPFHFIRHPVVRVAS